MCHPCSNPFDPPPPPAAHTGPPAAHAPPNPQPALEYSPPPPAETHQNPAGNSPPADCAPEESRKCTPALPPPSTVRPHAPKTPALPRAYQTSATSKLPARH